MTSTLLPRNTSPTAPTPYETEAAEGLTHWAVEQRDTLRALVAERGSLMVRGLGLREVSDLRVLARHLTAGAVTEREAFAAREAYGEGLYSSATWPPNQPMCMHHELSYTVEFPGLLLCACLRAPDEGGATAVADAHAVLQALPAELTSRFAREGWLLTRNYNDDIGASVSDSFGTDDPAAVEDYCRAHAIDFDRRPDGGLRTRQRRNAVVHHPVTGVPCWFNQIAFLNAWTLAPEIREYLVDEYGSDGLPFDTAYGDGDPISDDTVRLINSVYEAHTVRIPWQTGDLLLIDNISTAHSREPYTGPRDVVVAMADPVRMDDCSPLFGRADR
ncbi:TauD/TfdA family dioxygenase [Streptomyces sp. Qhu_M48]|uniref:TauD/TfdA family dioxygenase n=1 Tax=Streptomyces sp. Qhu_M48 TaxID=3435889 RepID=UPI003F4FB112